MLRRVLGAVLALAASCALSSCVSFEWSDEEHHLRYDAAKDVLVWVEIERGLTSGGTQAAVDELRALTAGARRFPPNGGLISVDLDERTFASTEPGPPPDPDPEQAATDAFLAALCERVEVERCGLFLDASGRLSLYRRTLIRDPRGALLALDRCVDKLLQLEAAKKEEFQPSFPVFDERTRDLCFALAAKGGAWLRLEGGSFVFEMPMTSSDAAACMLHVAKDGVPQASLFADLFSHLGALRIEGERLYLRLDPGADGAFHMTATEAEADYEPALQQAVEAAGLAVERERSLDSLRALAGGD